MSQPTAKKRDVDPGELGEKFLWVRLDDYPNEGFTTSVHWYEVDGGGWVLGDIALSVAQGTDPASQMLAGERPWLSTGPGAGITGAQLRSLNFSEIRSRVRAWIVEIDGTGSEGWDKALAQLYRQSRAGPKNKRTDRWMATLAQLYVEGLTMNIEGSVYDYMAAEVGYATGTLRGYIRECRDLGYLTPAPGPGVQGGRLTDFAIAILEGDDDE